MKILEVYVIMQVGLHIAMALAILAYGTWIAVLEPLYKRLF